MTVNYLGPEVDPSTIIRAYVWAVLKANNPTDWDIDNYGGMVPIVPFGEDSQMAQFEGPNITYITTHSPSNGPCMYGSTTMSISDTDARRLMSTVNIIRVALDRDDESATDINNFTSNHEIGSERPFVGIRFGYVSMAFSEGPSPAETEGGRNYASFSAEYEYYVNYQVQTSV